MLDIGVRWARSGASVSRNLRISCATHHPLADLRHRAKRSGRHRIDEIHELTRIDRCSCMLSSRREMYGRLARSTFPLPAEMLRDVKRLGFSDQAIGKLTVRDRVRARDAQAQGIESRLSN